MKNKPIVIIAGEPYSVFLEIFFKSLKEKKIKRIKNPIILVASKNLVLKQMKALKYNFYINEISLHNFYSLKINNNKLNLVNVNFNLSKTFDQISKKSAPYIRNSCEIGLEILKKSSAKVLINGPVSKKKFLNNKFPGMTEYFANKVGYKNKEVMLIFNNKVSVSPITTHLPLKKIFSKITKNKILYNVITINNFYKKYLKKKARFAITSLNPHGETLNKFSEEDKIITPAIQLLKNRKINIKGPYPSDTIFMKKNIHQFDVIIGMYHDQVLAPMKTIFEFDAINITLGLPFLRLTPDHGPNVSMLGKNISNPKSLIKALEFASQIK